MTDHAAGAARGGARLRFDPTITAGNLLMAATMLIGGISWGVRLESRVDHQDDLRSRLERRVDENAVNSRSDIGRIERLLERIDQKLDRKVDKAGAP